MSIVTLPSLPAPASMRVLPVTASGVQRGATGGAAQLIQRQGDRWRVEVAYPPLPNDEVGREFVADYIRARRFGVRMEFQLAGVDQGAPGAPVVNGAGQSGTALNVRGLTPGYVCKKGFWLSIVNPPTGRHHLHNAYVQRVADGSGLATLGIEPMQRVPFPDGAAIHLAQPMIEGFIDDGGWDVSLAHHIGLAFTVEEFA